MVASKDVCLDNKAVYVDDIDNNNANYNRRMELLHPLTQLTVP